MISRIRPLALWLFTVLPGSVITLVSGYYCLQDWAVLNRAFARWERLIGSGGSEKAITIAYGYQNAFRINCFAEGVGVCLGLVIVAIGVLGLCLVGRGSN